MAPLPAVEKVHVGIGYRRPYRSALLTGESVCDVLEIIPDHFFAFPEQIVPLAERYRLIFHDVGMSIGTPGLDRERLDRIVSLARLARPVRFTDHLAITRTPGGLRLGHLAPVPHVPDAVETCVENLKILQETLQIPVAVENIFATFWPGAPNRPGAHAELLIEVLERADVGLLLDLTNLWLEAQNLGEAAEVRLGRLPLHRAVAVHLAGGERGARGFLDTHSRPVHPEVLELLAGLSGHAPVEDVILERDSHLPPLAELEAEVVAARAAWTRGSIGQTRPDLP